MTEKKGFVLYFDAASSLAALCAEQRGELLLALFDYAERTAKQPLSPETALASYPALDEQTRMAFRFMANSIERDTKVGAPARAPQSGRSAALRPRTGRGGSPRAVRRGAKRLDEGLHPVSKAKGTAACRPLPYFMRARL